MHRFLGFCLCGVTTLVLAGCSTSAKPATTNQPSPAASSEYSLTQRSASDPDRRNCTGANCAEPAALDVGRCDLDLCEGELTAAAIADLRATAAKAQDCYERELKDKRDLEGKMVARIRLAAGREPCDIQIEQGSMKGSEEFTKCILMRLGETQARPKSGCVDVSLPLSFVRQEIEVPADAG